MRDGRKSATIFGRYNAVSGNNVTTEGMASYTGTDAADVLEGVQFLVSAGTMTGKISVYGYE